MLQGRLQFVPFESRVLVGNPLGDPTARDVLVYTPPGYDETRRFPLVMILPPFGSTHRTLVNHRLWEKNVFELYESLLVRGEVGEAILVVPDAINRWGGSQFIDSAGSGRYQSYVLDEVLPFVDRTFKTIPAREGRAVVGRSSGGFGALTFAMDRPELFAAIGSHAGDGAFEVSLRPTFTSAAIALDRAGGVVPFITRLESRGLDGPHAFDAVSMIAMAAAYSPRGDAPFPHCELPFDVATGEPIADVFAEHRAHDPLERLMRDASLLRSAELVFLDAGDRDEHGLQFAARRMATALRERGARVEHEEFAGSHRGTTQRYLVSLPRLVSVLARAT